MPKTKKGDRIFGRCIPTSVVFEFFRLIRLLSSIIQPNLFILYGNRFFREYFKLDNKKVMSEVKSGYAGGEISNLGYGVTAKGGSPMVPGYETRIIAEDERTLTFINRNGQTLKAIKSNPGMPMFLDWPIKDWATWKEHKKRLDPDTPERWPADWDAYAQQLNSQDDPVVLQVGGFYGFPRD